MKSKVTQETEKREAFAILKQAKAVKMSLRMKLSVIFKQAKDVSLPKKIDMIIA